MSRHYRSERGAALVETALLAPVFFVMLFAVIEGGYLIRDYQIISDAVGDGARTGGLMGPQNSADGSSPDYQVIRAIRAATGAIPADHIERIVVFKGSNPTGAGGTQPSDQVPSACKAGTPVTGSCNVYNDPEAAILAVESGDAGYFACPGSPVSCSWPSSTRKDGPTVAAIEFVGVWIRLERPYVTGLFGSKLTIEDASVSRIEVGALTG